jgi:hypothetical protein
MDRREFLDWLKVSTAATTIAAAASSGCAASEAPPRPASEAGLPIAEAQRKLQIGMLVYRKRCMDPVLA